MPGRPNRAAAGIADGSAGGSARRTARPAAIQIMQQAAALLAAGDGELLLLAA